MRTPSHLLRAVSLVAITSLAGCASAGRFVWADEYAAAAARPDYVVGAGDVIAVSVWGNERISARSRVRADGRISVPLLNDVDASGKTPAELASDIERRLRASDLVLSPRVTVQVEEIRPLSVAVLGAVARGGMYSLDQGAGVAEALAAAGGLTDFAHKDRIFVMRRDPQPARVRFTFASLTAADGRAAVFRLRAGDVVVAE